MSGKKFKLLMWKHYIVTKRRYFRTCLEFLVPWLLCILLTLLRSTSKYTHYPEKQFPPFNAKDSLGLSACVQKSNLDTVAYSPTSPFLKDIFTKLCPQANILEFSEASTLNSQLESNDSLVNRLIMAVLFNDDLKRIDSSLILPVKDLEVTLRLPTVNPQGDLLMWQTDTFFPTTPTPLATQPNLPYDGPPFYHYRGFLLLQQMITTAFILDGNLNQSLDLSISLEKFPYPKWSGDQFYGEDSSLTFFLSLLIGLSFIIRYINNVQDIISEKEKQLKESMRAMGLPNYIMWSSWFTYSLIISLIVITVLTCLCTLYIFAQPIYSLANPLIVFLFFLLVACCVTTFSFFISAIFSKAITGVTVGAFVFIFTMLPFIVNMDVNLSVVRVAIESLLVGSAICYGSAIIIFYEKTGDGLHWRNMWTPGIETDASFGLVCVLLLTDTIIYLLLALYIDAINPGQYGIPQPWYFICTRQFWTGEVDEIVTSNRESQTSRTSSEIEKYSGNAPVGVRIKNLCRTFGTNKVVNNLNLEMYEGQITALLGHNGAGKTTTMSMISGMLLPTSGSIEVYGHDVRTDFENIRGLMGLCPQHNILFDELNCYEHLYFMCKLKGMPEKEIEEEINEYLTMLNLEDKRKALSKTLSGGMKRRLNIGMALCGNSKMVIFDEPTAGLDPSARRNIWDLLQSQREGRTMLLTTHFMDEADLLGDRIAIMSAGEIQCVGTSFFLKKKYGAGYNLIMEVSPKCRPHNITTFLSSHIPGAKVQSHAGTELIYLLPSKDSSKFAPLLQGLESKMKQFKIISYGIAPISLEEIFLKVGADQETRGLKAQRTDSKLGGLSGNWYIRYESGLVLFKNQIYAMFYKKIMYIRRSWFLYLFTQVLIPVFTLCWIALASKSEEKTEYEALRIDLDMYKESVTLVSGDKYIFYENYKIQFKGHKLLPVSDVSDEILSEVTDDLENLRNHYIVAASFLNSQAIAWFNSYPLHSAPLSLGLVLDSVYKVRYGKDYSIVFTNHPLRATNKIMVHSIDIFSTGIMSNALLYITIPVVATYILFYVKERVCESKHLQFVSGTKSYIFWIVAFICDFIVFFVAVTVIVVTVYALQLKNFSTPEGLGMVVVILTYFGFFAIALIFLLSLFFSSPAGGVNGVLVLGIVTGTVMNIAVPILQKNSEDTADYIIFFFLFFPFSSLMNAIKTVGMILERRRGCSLLPPAESDCKINKACCDLDYYAMDKTGIGRNIVIGFGMGLLILLFLIIKEEGAFKFIARKCRASKKPQPKEKIDSDVKKEEDKIRSSYLNNTNFDEEYILVLRDMTKYFGNFLAVNGLCLGVKQYECFGLLGANGAGKTTSFKMMTGEESINYGEVWIKGISVVKNLKKAQAIIGYCPQFDALLEELTPRETLKLFCLIRGVNLNSCRSVGEFLAKTLDFSKHLDKKVKQLSGGNKRKLSLAIAVIGDPVILFLDEPTTSMDPATKRFVWNTLAKLRDAGKSIILTSHSMEECEALCTRIVVMVRGHFMCLGSTQRLKNKFAQGYSLTINVKKTKNLQRDIVTVKRFIRKNFPESELKEEFQELLTFQLSDTSMPCSEMFRLMESKKQELKIQDYSLQQCSLEEVFLSFTRPKQ